MRRVLAGGLLAVLACVPPRSPAPPPLPADCCRWQPLIAALDSAVADGAAPGAVVGVSIQGLRYFYSTGQLGGEDSTPPGPETVFDLASLTKVVGLTTAVALAVDAGTLRVDAPAGRYVPSFRSPDKEGVTLRHLLTHSSGLPAHRRLWELAPDRAAALSVVNTTPLDTVPAARMVYSDLGAIVLTEAVEQASGRSLDSLLDEQVFAPLGMTSTRFLPPPSWTPRIAPTERDPWRGRVLRGEVHDENAARLGGVSGHAGLFGTADDLLRFGEWLLGQRTGRRPRWAGPADTPRLRRETAETFTSRQAVVPGSSRALGWDTPSPGSSAGRRLSAQSFGHTGFTGTSIWIDPSRELIVVLLSNRVHPTRDNVRFLPLRALVADRVVELIEGTGGAPD